MSPHGRPRLFDKWVASESLNPKFEYYLSASDSLLRVRVSFEELDATSLDGYSPEWVEVSQVIPKMLSKIELEKAYITLKSQFIDWCRECQIAFFTKRDTSKTIEPPVPSMDIKTPRSKLVTPSQIPMELSEMDLE